LGTAAGGFVFLRSGPGQLDRISHTPWALCRRRLVLERESKTERKTERETRRREKRWSARGN
jgi:hypothetical protein